MKRDYNNPVWIWWDGLTLQEKKDMAKKYYKKSYPDATMRMPDRIAYMFREEETKKKVIIFSK